MYNIGIHVKHPGMFFGGGEGAVFLATQNSNSKCQVLTKFLFGGGGGGGGILGHSKL